MFNDYDEELKFNDSDNKSCEVNVGVLNKNEIINDAIAEEGGINVSVIPLKNVHESFDITNVVDLKDLNTKILTKIINDNSIINHLLIKLYFDVGKTKQITNNQDLYNHQINEIYYEIILKFDKLEKIKKVGEGAFDKVYKYRNKNTNQLFALKVFDLSRDSTNRKAFEMECDCFLMLGSHPRIIKYVIDCIVNQNSYIWMEYMERGSLGSYVKVKGPFGEPRISKFGRQILEALKYIHDKGILHRDLKGDNILLDENDDLKLCDFGLAKIFTDLSSEDFLNELVQLEMVTLNWMSPEIVSGEKCGPASDIWSFGATMVEIVTRKPPHAGLTFDKIKSNILAGQMKFEYPVDSSDDMKSFINSCLKRNPEERASIKNLYQHSFLQNNHKCYISIL